jgi:AAA15 family ATPase/GTPase
MIIDLTVTNFRSIKAAQTLSMFVENARGNLPENIAFPNADKIGALKTVGIYGANASGKSNILLAFEALKYIAAYSGDLKDGARILAYEPFILSDSTKHAPVSFEIEFFTSDNVRFVYAVSFSANKITKESLDFYPSKTKANLFNRQENSTWESISFGSLYKGGKKRFAFFQNNSYLSKAGNSADSPVIIRTAYDFLINGFLHIGAEEKIKTIVDDINDPILLSDILCGIDTGISKISIENTEVEEKNFIFPKDTPEIIKQHIISKNRRKFFFSHKADNGEIEKFPEHLESSGTLKMFNMLPVLMHIFATGGVLLLDELDNNLHPHIAELIIKLFNDDQVNKKNAQLIFSTHNIQIMSPEYFRRDQVWFTEKNDGATELYSLESFDKNQVKTTSPYGQWYSEGRFGAVPKIDYRAIASALVKAGASDA